MKNGEELLTPSTDTKGALDGKVYAMPSYYLPKTKESRFSQKQILLVLIAIIFVLIVLVFSVILFRSSQPTSIATPTTPVEPVTPIVEDPQVEDPDPIVEEEPEEDPIVEEVEEPSEPSITLPLITLANVQVASDTDQDGLTDQEEALFLTNAAIPDTDQDSFLDGSELTGLYDPATPGAFLEVSPQVKTVRNTARSYQLLVPFSWNGVPTDPSGDSFIIRPGDGTESFRIDMYENTDRMTPVQWYQDQDPSADLSQFNNFTNEAGWNGIRSQDGRVVIATFGSTGVGARAFIFVMHYDPGTNQLMQYPTVWTMMLQSMAVLEPEQPLSSTSNSAQ